MRDTPKGELRVALAIHAKLTKLDGRAEMILPPRGEWRTCWKTASRIHKAQSRGWNLAAAQLKQTELAEQETRRRSELELTQAYHKLAAARSQETALQRAETSAKAGYQAELADYQLGLINNLNLLQSLRDLQENRLANNQAHYQTKLEYLQLLLAAGDLPPKELSLEVTP